VPRCSVPRRRGEIPRVMLMRRHWALLRSRRVVWRRMTSCDCGILGCRVRWDEVFGVFDADLLCCENAVSRVQTECWLFWVPETWVGAYGSGSASGCGSGYGSGSIWLYKVVACTTLFLQRTLCLFCPFPFSGMGLGGGMVRAFTMGFLCRYHTIPYHNC
jgi:hypothetical protein